MKVYRIRYTHKDNETMTGWETCELNDEADDTATNKLLEQAHNTPAQFESLALALEARDELNRTQSGYHHEVIECLVIPGNRMKWAQP